MDDFSLAPGRPAKFGPGSIRSVASLFQMFQVAAILTGQHVDFP
jgi:hypothetical protein